MNEEMLHRSEEMIDLKVRPGGYLDLRITGKIAVFAILLAVFMMADRVVTFLN